MGSSGKATQQPGAKASSSLLATRVAWARMATLIEVKVRKDEVPFGVQGDKLVVLDTKGAKRTRAQMIRYAAEVQLCQHRKFFLSAIIHGRLVWLMRWDRAGAIVSLPFDYTKKPEGLLNFAYRIARAQPSVQGYDPTACLASNNETEKFRSYKDSLPSDSRLRHYAQEVFDNLKYHPMYKVCIPVRHVMAALRSSVRSNVLMRKTMETNNTRRRWDNLLDLLLSGHFERLHFLRHRPRADGVSQGLLVCCPQNSSPGIGCVPQAPGPWSAVYCNSGSGRGCNRHRGHARNLPAEFTCKRFYASGEAPSSFCRGAGWNATARIRGGLAIDACSSLRFVW